MDIHFLQHNILKRLSFLLCVFGTFVKDEMTVDIWIYFWVLCWSICFYVSVCVLVSHVQLFVTPLTVAHQTSLSMEFSRQNNVVGCHSLLQGVFPTQGSNLGLLYCMWILYHLSYQGSLITIV